MSLDIEVWHFTQQCRTLDRHMSLDVEVWLIVLTTQSTVFITVQLQQQHANHVN